MSKIQKLTALLKYNPTLLAFAKAFHARLTAVNQQRVVGQYRTAHEVALDSLGRLLVGDEVCAAVALDDKWLIATNRNNHVTSDIAVFMGPMEIVVDVNCHHADITTHFKIIATANDGRHKEINLTDRRVWTYDRNKHQLIPRNKLFNLSISPDEHGIAEYNDTFSIDNAFNAYQLEHHQQLAPRANILVTPAEPECIFRAPLDAFRRRAGTLFFHMSQAAQFVFKGDGVSINGEEKSRYEIMRQHRERVMLQTFFWNAATWYPVFAHVPGRPDVNLADCQAQHHNRDVFIALLPHDQFKRLSRNLELKAKAIQAIKQNVRIWIAEGQYALQGKVGQARRVARQAWFNQLQTSMDINDDVKIHLENTQDVNYFIERFKEYFIAIEHLRELQCYIEQLVKSCNAALSKSRDNAGVVIREWANELSADLISNHSIREEQCPEFMRQPSTCSLTEFFNRFARYYIDILRIENYVINKARNMDKQENAIFISCLMNIQNYDSYNAHGLFVPKIIDHLAYGSHAEVRLFYYMIEVLKRAVQSIPYFGITQLCCATCQALLTGHGLGHEEGRRHHAGTHAKHYPGWVLDDLMCSVKNLRALLGTAWNSYNNLKGSYTCYGEQRSLKDWAKFIIQELAALDTASLNDLGISGQQLFPPGSNYAQEDFAPLATDDFYRSLPQMNITRHAIRGDGACQFRAVLRGSNNLKHNPKGVEDKQVAELRKRVVDHIRAHRDRYQEFLAAEINAGNIHQDVAYLSMDDYLTEMAKDNTYGDHLSLQALAEILNRTIVVARPAQVSTAPVTLDIIRPREDLPFRYNEALILIFNGTDHYDLAATRGNHHFHRLVYAALPEMHTRAATTIQAVFRGYRVRKLSPANTALNPMQNQASLKMPEKKNK